VRSKQATRRDAIKHGKSPSVQRKRPRRRIIFFAAVFAVPLGAAFYSAYFSFPVDGSPSWSPDGNRIVFYSERDGNSEIYVMQADGSNPTRLTRTAASEGYPNFSPDGKKIVFDTDRDGNFEIYAMNADGSNATRLTNDPARDVSASWSLDGRKIAFMSDRTGEFEVWVMDADGSNPTRVTDFGSNWFPRWSPDGSRLAYHVGRDVHVLDVRESKFARLTIDPNNGMYPSWSPDGRQIAFMSWRAGPTEIFVMNADGSDQRRLTQTTTGDSIDPRWSPDGRRIAFVHVPRGLQASGPKVIYVMNAEGTSARRLSRWWLSLETLGQLFTPPIRAVQAKLTGPVTPANRIARLSLIQFKPPYRSTRLALHLSVYYLGLGGIAHVVDDDAQKQ
jgi:Tol biopolymer transport system component